ncbi:M16 family metallopeptidase [Tundrisphaera lichenicola]|uniref:M16 family metallopeptidase n=1 Tax=Tundrisphaera lichenicola TaxID=2029860 RepID=UPI003EBCDAB5
MRRTMNRLAFAVLAALALCSWAPARLEAQDKGLTIPDLKVETYKLANGLEVILHEDHTTPFVGVNLWYKVGSKDEKPGRTGFAHLFEHLMFQGSEHHDSEYFGPLEKLGAQINGSTNTDRTNYYEALPTNGLEVALWLESDRMGFLLPALTQGKLDNQRDVVKNERRQRVDNVPYGQSRERLDEVLYPSDHPYHHSVIGSMADLSAASLEDVSNFFRTYYSPNNASLAIAGDFDPTEARKLVEKYFGPIPKGPEVTKPEPSVPVLTESQHITMTDAVQLSLTQLVWPTVPTGHPDEAPLDALASILGQLPNENRLFRALQYDKQLAAQASAFHPTANLGGTFRVSIVPQKGQKLDDLIAISDAEIDRLKKDGPTEDEVRKVKNSVESSSIFSLQTAQNKSDFLNRYNVTYGDPLAYKAELARNYAVTADDVKRVANKYLVANRIRLDVNPGPKTPRPEEAEVDRAAQSPLPKVAAKPIEDSFDRDKEPAPGPNPTFQPAPAVRRKLSNGLEVLIVERHNLPIVALNLVVKGGETLVPIGKEGLAPLTGSLLTEGTTTRNSLQLAGELAELGASIDGSGGDESCSLSLTTLTRQLPKALDLYTDVLLHPSFPDKELERLRVQRLAALLRRSDNPPSIAGIVFPKIIYGDKHPYGRYDTPESIKSLKRDDVVALYKSLFVPNNSALIVVGDTTPDAIIPVLEDALKEWKPGSPVARVAPETPESSPVTVFLVDKPGSAQSILSVGQVGVPRNTPDYFPISIMNAVLGGQFSSRINLNLREDKGYTYGARSGFSFRLGAGPFQAGAPVKTEDTRPALIELIKELTDITGPRPVTDTELAFAKDRVVKGFPSRFESVNGVASALDDVVLYDLPADFYTTYRDQVDAVTKADVERVAKKYLDPSRMAILIVGDRAKVEPTLKDLPFAKEIQILDTDGNPVAGTPKADEAN